MLQLNKGLNLTNLKLNLNIILDYFTGGQILNQFVRWAKNWILSSGSYVQTAKYIFLKLKQNVCHSFLYYSPRLRTEHGRVMFELIGRWKVWGRVKILISESSPPLVQTEKGEGSDDDLEKVFSVSSPSTDYLVHWVTKIVKFPENP